MKYRKLSLKKARRIRELYFGETRVTQAELARGFGCSQVNIGLVVRNKIYREVEA